MTITTRNRSRDPNLKTSFSQKTDRDATVDSRNDSSGANVPSNACQSYVGDQASRLSEDFQPLDLNQSGEC